MLGQQGIHEPTEVQQAAIPAILAGGNTAVRCYTGSGKTLAYLLPALTLAVERAEQEWANVTRKTVGQAGSVQVGGLLASCAVPHSGILCGWAMLPAGPSVCARQRYASRRLEYRSLLRCSCR